MKQTVEEILASYPKEIVNFFEEEKKMDGWEIEQRLGGYLPSPAQQLINRVKGIENEEVYEVIFTFKRSKNESNKNG